MNLNQVAGQRHWAPTAVISGTIVLASSAPYFFVGALPMWIALGLLGFVLASINGRLWPRFIFRHELRWVVALWLVLIAVTAMLDSLAAVPRDLMGGAVLNFTTLLVFVGAFGLAAFANVRFVIGTIFAIAAFQGLVAIAQFLGSDAAWRLPDMLASSLSSISKIEYSSTLDYTLLSFDQIGRVRGSLPEVHLFNQIQALLVAVSVVVALTDSKLRPGSHLLSNVAVIIAAIGLLLTFSRSGVLAMFCAGLLGLYLNPKPSRIFRASIGGFMLLVGLAYIGFSDGDQFYRLTQGLSEGGTNNLRWQQYQHAVNNFKNSPLIGSSGPTGFVDLGIPIHSVPLRYLNDYGLIGVVLYFSILCGLSLVFLRRIRSPSKPVSVWAGCGLAVLSVVIVDSWTHSSGFLRRDLLQTTMLGFAAGAMFVSEWREGRNARRPTGSKTPAFASGSIS